MRTPKGVPPDFLSTAVIALDDVALELIELAMVMAECDDHASYDVLVGLAGRVQCVAQDLIGDDGVN